MTTAETATVIAICTGLVTLITAIIRATQTIERLRSAIAEQEDRLQRTEADLNHEIEKLQLVVNGVRERMEHINTRISAQQKETQQSLIEMETFLVKTTAFERRRSRD